MKPYYRILVVCGGSHVAGLEIINLTLMRQLKENGHVVFCLLSGWNDGEFITRLQEIDIAYKSVKLGNMYISQPIWTLTSMLNFPKAVFKIKNLLKKYKPDIVILNDCRNFLYTGFLWKGFKLIYWEHNLPIPSFFNWLTYKTLYKKSSAIVACSDFIKSRLYALIKRNSKILTIHNSVEVSDMGSLVRHSDWTESTRIGIVGQVIPRKGHLMLMEALAILKNKNLNCAVYIYGNYQTEYAKEVQNFVKQHDLEQNVHWMGFVNDKNNIYGNLDIVVVPSIDEPFGLVALEPALWEIPVVAMRSGGLPEIIEDKNTGLLFEPGNFRELSAQLEQLSNSTDERMKLGKQAKIRLFQSFLATQMASRFIEIFDRLDIPKSIIK